MSWFGKATNLHSVWDSALVDDEQLSFSELADKLERHMSDEQRIDWWDINPRDWVSESAQIRDSLYPPAGQAGGQARTRKPSRRCPPCPMPMSTSSRR